MAQWILIRICRGVADGASIRRRCIAFVGTTRLAGRQVESRRMVVQFRLVGQSMERMDTVIMPQSRRKNMQQSRENMRA
jgi:hypothetical protein